MDPNCRCNNRLVMAVSVYSPSSSSPVSSSAAPPPSLTSTASSSTTSPAHPSARASRLAGLDHHASSLSFPPGSDLSRTVLIVPLRILNIAFVGGYISKRQPLGALLFLLPRVFSYEGEEGSGDDNAVDGEKGLLKNLLLELEQLLIHAHIPYPVYFAFEDDDIAAVLSDIKKNDIGGQPATATAGGCKLVVSVNEPRKVASPVITNIQGWLPGLKSDGASNQLPTIAVVASYDTFGAGPASSVGSDSNGSGVMALLEIARWTLLTTMELISIGSSENELWLHVSKPPENAYVKQLIEGFSNVAEELQMKVGLKHKKINIYNPRVAWEHEQFSRLGVTAATLSQLSTTGLFEHTNGLSDSRKFVGETAVIKAAKLVAESLAA